jgi:hypothetical protein
MGSRTRVDELSKIELVSARAVAEYAKVCRELLRDFTRELEFAADEFEATMRAADRSGHPLLVGLDVRWRARRVAGRLRRAADCTAGAAAEVVRFHTQFRREFAPALSPDKKKERKFDFGDG